jgi:hypothetical protein
MFRVLEDWPKGGRIVRGAFDESFAVKGSCGLALLERRCKRGGCIPDASEIIVYASMIHLSQSCWLTAL